MVGRTDGWMDGLVDGWMERWIDVSMDRWTDEWIDGSMNGDGCLWGLMDGLVGMDACGD